MEIKIPSLADRREDVPLLQRYFVERFAAQYGKVIRGLTRRAQAVLGRHSWPGNIRELENVIGYACMMAESEIVDVHDLPESIRESQRDALESTSDLMSLEQSQQRHAAKVLELVGGNKVRAAEVLDISRATLYRLLREIQPEAADTPKKTVSHQIDRGSLQTE